MNPRVMKKQNDISIIGKLPKRLQQKFAEGASGANLDNDIIEDFVEKKPESRTFSKGVVRMQSTTEDANVSVQQRKRNTTEECTLDPFKKFLMESKQDYGQSVDDLIIPGILRIAVRDVNYTTKSTENGDTGLERGQKQKRQSQQHKKYDHKQLIDLPVSPARQNIINIYPKWFDAIEQFSHNFLKKLYDTLNDMMHRQIVVKNWTNFKEIHAELLEVYDFMLVHQLKLCCEHKIDSFFWKLLYYNVREHLKFDGSEEARKNIVWLIDNGLVFYKSVYKKLMAKYVCNKNGVNKMEGINGFPQYGLKYENIAIVCLQKILIYMGDLSRYKSKHLQLNNFTDAYKYYSEAFTLIPSNGVPYNKLGVISIQMRNKFDAVYFQMRSLMAINSVYSAKESLTVIYDEIRKKYEETELPSSPIHQYKESNGHANRKEVWIYPNGVRRIHRALVNKTNKVTLSQENRLNSVPTEELLRRFLSTFIYINGKFYIGVDMDSIEAFERKLLVQLSILLKRSPLAISHSKLLKIVALNIFVIEHNKNKKAAGREIRYHAFNFANEIFGSIVNRVNQLLIDYIEAGPAFEKNYFTDLNTLLQYIKIYSDWMSLNIDIWEPVRNEHIVIDPWFELQSLFKTLYYLQKHEMAKNENVIAEDVILDENNFLLGFTPLTLKQNNYYKVNDTPQETQFYARTMIISKFQQFYEKHDDLLKLPDDLSFDIDDIDDVAEMDFKSLSSDEDESTDSDNNENIGTNVFKQTENITSLTKLDPKNNGLVHNGCKNLDVLLNYVNITYIIEVRPKFLLLDTNCFIDSLNDFVTLTHTHSRFILVVPLTVIKELDGLSKGIKREMDKNIKRDRLQHYDDVTTAAKKSLEFLKAPKCNVKFVTTRGSFIQSSLFGLVEEENISNDDKILASALSLYKNMSTQKTKQNKCLIRTELVVITTDRNLRVKALTRNLAVSGLNEFLQWLSGCSS